MRKDVFLDWGWLPGPVRENFDYVVPFVLTSAMLLAIHAWFFWFDFLGWLGLPVVSTFTMAPAYIPVIFSAYHGAIRGGILSTLMVIIYTIYIVPGILSDFRIFLIVATMVAIVVPMGLLVERLRKIDNADTVLARLDDLDTYVKGLLLKWAGQAERKVPIHPGYEELRHINHRITNLLTMVVGWHELAKERKSVLDDELNTLDTQP